MEWMGNEHVYISILLGFFVFFLSVGMLRLFEAFQHNSKASLWSFLPLKKQYGGVYTTYLQATRLYFLYAIMLQLSFIVFFNYESFSQISLTIFTFPAIIQAALLVYLHVLLRGFYDEFSKLKHSFALKVGFFLWVVLVLLIGIDQIIRVPLFTLSILSFFTGNTDILLQDPTQFSLAVTVFTIGIAFYGEMLFRKIVPART